MTRDDVIRMAREAGFQTGLAHDRDGNVSYTFAKFQGENCLHSLEVFASLVAAAEREACAKVCEDEACGGSAFNSASKYMANRIRASGT